jgi:23S rRNA pseudouridine2605 synthase
MASERLQKVLSAAGVASRRAAEEMILEGRVTVNGRVVTELGTKADPAIDHVKVDGKLVRLPLAHRYVLLNKPRGLVVTREDPGGRDTVFALLKNRVRERLVSVGRLDTDSEGLLLLTNDGALVQKLTHPSGGCRKEYEVKVSGIPTPAQLDRLRRGITLDDGVRTAPAVIETTETTPQKDGVGGNTWLRVILGEGRSRQIRRMFQRIGHPVSKIRRVAIGPLRDRSLPAGAWRDLAPEEVEALRTIPAAPLRPAALRRPLQRPRAEKGRRR